MPRERFTYTVDFPGLRAPGLDVGRLVASFDVTDYTGTTEDRALAMRELVAAAVTMACRRLAAEQPELLRSPVVVDRAEGSLALRLPTWFKGAPPESLVRVISEALANAAAQAGGQVAARLVEDAVEDLDPEEKLALKKTYEAAAAALREGNQRRGIQLLNQAEQQRAWHQAALQVGADLPAAAGAVRRTMPPMAEMAAQVERVLASAGGRAPGFGDQAAVSGNRVSEFGDQDTVSGNRAVMSDDRVSAVGAELQHASRAPVPGTERTVVQSPGGSAQIQRDGTQVHADPRNSMQVLADPRNSMQLHASPRNSMLAPHNSTLAPQDPMHTPQGPGQSRGESTRAHEAPHNPASTRDNSTKAIEANRDSTKAIEANRGSTKAIEANRGSTKAIEANRDAAKAIEANRDAAKAIEANRDSAKAIEVNRDSTKAIEANRGSTKAIEANRDSSKAIEANRDSAKAIEVNRDSTKAIEANRDAAQVQSQAPVPPRPNALIDPPTPPAQGGRPPGPTRPAPVHLTPPDGPAGDADWLTDLAREAEALLWAPGPAETKAVLLAALLGPLPPELLAVPLTARPPQADKLTKQQARAATRSLEAYLDGLPPAEALQPPRRRRKP